jgi:hypothetical protein
VLKAWYLSKTIWIAVSLVAIVVGSYLNGDMTLRTAIATGLIGIGTAVNRYYTDVPLKRLNGNGRENS